MIQFFEKKPFLKNPMSTGKNKVSFILLGETPTGRKSELQKSIISSMHYLNSMERLPGDRGNIR